MGEIAEMMLDGTLCEGCGVYIDDGEAEGFPRYCSRNCAADRGFSYIDSVIETQSIPVEHHLSEAYLHVGIEYLKGTINHFIAEKNFKKAKALKGILKNIIIFKNSLRK